MSLDANFSQFEPFKPVVVSNNSQVVNHSQCMATAALSSNDPIVVTIDDHLLNFLHHGDLVVVAIDQHCLSSLCDFLA